MWLDVVGRGVEVSRAGREQVERRFRVALGRVAERLGRVTVRLSDVNGPKGGVDKRCVVTAEVVGLGTAVVRDADSDLDALVGRAADRAGLAVLRLLARARRFTSTRLRAGLMTLLPST